MYYLHWNRCLSLTLLDHCSHKHYCTTSLLPPGMAAEAPREGATAVKTPQQRGRSSWHPKLSHSIDNLEWYWNELKSENCFPRVDEINWILRIVFQVLLKLLEFGEFSTQLSQRSAITDHYWIIRGLMTNAWRLFCLPTWLLFKYSLTTELPTLRDASTQSRT